MCSMVDPCILAILAFRLIEDFIGAIQEGPAYVWCLLELLIPKECY